MNITTDELLEAIQQALGPATGDGQTVEEICEKTGWGRTKIRQTLVQLHRNGRLEVHRVKRRSLDGRQQSVPAYRIKGEK